MPHWAYSQESGKSVARHIMKCDPLKMKPTFVWSSIGGLHIRSVGAQIQQSIRTVFFEHEKSSICFYKDEFENIIGACTINADPVVARLATLLETQKVSFCIYVGAKGVAS
jgi:hypothetical protein